MYGFSLLFHDKLNVPIFHRQKKNSNIYFVKHFLNSYLCGSDFAKTAAKIKKKNVKPEIFSYAYV